MASIVPVMDPEVVFNAEIVSAVLFAYAGEMEVAKLAFALHCVHACRAGAGCC